MNPAAPPRDGRKIGFWTCTALVVGNTIGMGIFVLPASMAPLGYNALLGWGITVLGCLALARVLAQLARLLPGADGPYGYVRHTLGGLPAYAVLWSYWVSNWITLAALATGVVGYAAAIFPRWRACRRPCCAWACCGCSSASTSSACAAVAACRW